MSNSHEYGRKKEDFSLEALRVGDRAEFARLVEESLYYLVVTIYILY